MTGARNLSRIAALLGILTAVLAAVIFPTFPSSGHAISDGYGGAVYAFEMARIPADLIAVFGPEGDPMREARIAAMDKGNIWDYPFMTIYAAFMAVFLLAIFKETGQARWKYLALIAVLSGVADGIENWILLGITADITVAPLLPLLAIPVWIKFFSIAIAVASAGLYMVHRGGLWRLAGVVILIAMLSVPLSFIDAARFGYLAGTGIGVGWTLMLIYAARRSFG